MQIHMARSKDGIQWHTDLPYCGRVVSLFYDSQLEYSMEPYLTCCVIYQVLGAGESNCFDVGGVLACHVVRLPGEWTMVLQQQKITVRSCLQVYSVFHVSDSGHLAMFYEGINKDGLRSIGMAICENGDGISWKKREEPVLESIKGEGDTWDSGGVGKPSVILFKSSIRLYFEGRKSPNSLPSGIGLATASLKDFEFKRY